MKGMDTVRMPSNIALIKYMGKKDIEKNLPANTSLSWTLPYLYSSVRIEEADEWGWRPLESDCPLTLSQKGQDRFLTHLKNLCETWNISSRFVVSSGNNFPSDCGVASSASSFAALTEAFFQKCAPSIPPEERALWSSKGSGSSCRSFFPNWVLWEEQSVRNIESPFSDFFHCVILADKAPKAVSSSEAHKRVPTSSLYPTRLFNVGQRIGDFLQAMETGDWSQMYQLAWVEFWEMHSLFETSHPHFGYFNAQSVDVLQRVRLLWQDRGDGPLVTMDAGPNVHLLWRKDQRDSMSIFLNQHIVGRLQYLSNLETVDFVSK